MTQNIKNSDLIIEVIADIILSPRWEKSTAPLPDQVKELSERINHGKTYQSLIKDPDLELLIEIIQSYETALNDDWMPFKIQGLELPQALDFIKGIQLIIQRDNKSEYPSQITELYKKTKPPHS